MGMGQVVFQFRHLISYRRLGRAALALLGMAGAAHADEPYVNQHTGRIAFAQNGKCFVGICGTEYLLVWEGSKNRPVKEIKLLEPGQNQAAERHYGFAVDPQGQRAVTGSTLGRIHVVDLDQGLVTRRIDMKTKFVLGLCFNPDGAQLACIDAPGGHFDSKFSLTLLDARTWSVITTLPFEGLRSGERSMAFSADGKQLFVAGGHPSDLQQLGFTGITSWDLGSRKIVKQIKYDEGFPVSMSLSPDGKWIATGGGDAVPSGPNARSLSGHLKIWDVENTRLVKTLDTRDHDYFRTVAFAPNGKILYAGSAGPSGPDGAAAQLHAYRTSDWGHLWTTEVHENGGCPLGLAVSPDSRLVMVPSSDALYVVDAQGGKVVGELMKFKSPRPQVNVRRR